MKHLVIALSLIALLACSALKLGREEVNGEIHVFGVALFSDIDHKTLEGENAVAEPCTKGYEYVFERVGVTIGYGHNSKVRRLATRNSQSAMFGVKPGDGYAAAKAGLEGKGFGPGSNGYNFRRGWCSLTLLVDESGIVFGMAAEVLE